jgi:hypothetical protein
MNTTKNATMILVAILLVSMIAITIQQIQTAQAVFVQCPNTDEHPTEECLATSGRETLKAIIRGLFDK